MKYTYKGEEYNIPDKEVDRLVNALEISIAEACELYLNDKGIGSNQEQDNLDNELKGAKRHYESTGQRKKTEKVRKVDEDKAEILGIIHETLEITPDLFLTGQKNEVELYFEYKNNNYTLKLTKHRPKK